LAREPGVTEVLVSNRTWQKAVDLANSIGGRPVELGELAAALDHADVLLASTGAPSVIVEAEDLAAVMAQRRRKPLLVVDVAVPRDVDPAVGQLPDVTLLDMDDIRAFADAGLAERRREVASVQSIVDAEVERYERAASVLDVAPIIASLRDRAEDIRANELARHRARLSDLDPREREAVESLTRGIVNKILHNPTVRMREEAGSARGERLAEALRTLFDV
jgi:glutamyl-tRNA reductase